MYKGGHVLPPFGHASFGGGHLVKLPSLGPSLISELDFTTPSLQLTPDTAAGFASALGDEVCEPDEIWLYDEASGNLVGKVGAAPLVPISAPIYAQDAPGIWDGSDYASRKCAEFASVGTRIAHASSSYFDNATNSFAVLVEYRDLLGTSGALVSKKDTGAGWGLRTVTGSGLRVTVSDGVTTITLSGGTTSGAGSRQYACIIVNQTTKLVWLITPEIVVSASISALGSLASAPGLTIGSSSGYLATSVGKQVLSTETFTLAAAEALTKAKLDNWFNAGRSDLTTESRACPITAQVADGYYAHFAPDIAPIAYNENFTDISRRGLRANSAKVNEVPYPETSTGANNTGVTPTDFGANAPDGFKSATTLLSTVPAGYQEKVCTTLASTVYTGSMLIEEVTVGVQGRVVAYDLSNGAEIGATAFTATGIPKEVAHVFTTPVGCISVGLRCEITNNAETVIAWGWCLNTGHGRVYVRNNGSPTALIASLYKADFDTSTSLGEIASVHVWNHYTPGTSGWVYDCVPSTGTANRKRTVYDGVARSRFYLLDGLGSLEDLITFNTGVVRDAEVSTRSAWDQSLTGASTGGYESTAARGATKVNGAPSPWDGSTSTGSSTSVVEIGSTVGVQHFDGDIQSIKSYDGPLPL